MNKSVWPYQQQYPSETYVGSFIFFETNQCAMPKIVQILDLYSDETKN